MKQSSWRILTLALAAVCTLANTTSAQVTETVLYNFFHTSTDVAFSQGGLVFDTAGNLYGTGTRGGAFGFGGIYEISPGTGGWTEQVIYSFAGGTDGGNPGGNLIIDASGNLYGTNGSGGSGTCVNGCGQIYELSPSSSGWTKTILHSFTGGGAGQTPVSGVIFDSAGNLYGTAIAGGASSQGLIYELSPSSSGWTFSVLYSFKGGVAGFSPRSSLVFDSAGRLYGTTYAGGTSTVCFGGCGTIYQLTPPSAGSFWTYQVLHSFNNRDGEGPTNDSLVFDGAGNLYGTTTFGGTQAFEDGTVFELSPTAGGHWKLAVLHSFGAGYEGGLPQAGLTFDAAGNLWGTASGGGLNADSGNVFELTPAAGGQWSYARVYGFKGLPNDGYSPRAKVTLDSLGNIYGTTEVGGAKDEGIVFELSPVAGH
jgi:uncharacterized repeat protein (TIGR03803 family)